MNFSEKIKEIRKKEGISQEQLAERIGVSRQGILLLRKFCLRFTAMLMPVQEICFWRRRQAS